MHKKNNLILKFLSEGKRKYKNDDTITRKLVGSE